MSQPLTEVFGYPPHCSSVEAERNRKLRFCPYSNDIPNCTKDSAKNPLGVCSIRNSHEEIAIICPVRFRENWLVIENAAKVFFPPNATWTTLQNVNLYDIHENLVDHIDFVLVSYDQRGKVIDFAALDTVASYTKNSLGVPFSQFIENREMYFKTTFKDKNIPEPDALFTLQRRLAPQIIYKGSVFHAWQKKMGYVLDQSLFNAMPESNEVPFENAEIFWFVYHLKMNQTNSMYNLNLKKIVSVLFEPTLFQITRIEAGPMERFVQELESQLNENPEERYPPETINVTDFFKPC